MQGISVAQQAELKLEKPYELTSVWLFNPNNKLLGAVFSTHDLAEAWLTQNKLAGLLTEYSLNVSIYEWAVTNGWFKPKKPTHTEPRFIGSFTSAYQPHFHFN